MKISLAAVSNDHNDYNSLIHYPPSHFYPSHFGFSTYLVSLFSKTSLSLSVNVTQHICYFHPAYLLFPPSISVISIFHIPYPTLSYLIFPVYLSYTSIYPYIPVPLTAS